MTRIRLEELPGFDPVGLRVEVDSHEGRLLLLPPNSLGEYDAAEGSPESLLVAMRTWVTRAESVTLDATESATADRLARYVAARTGAECELTAPAWWWITQGTRVPYWELHARTGRAFASRPWVALPGRTWSEHWHILPGLPEPRTPEEEAEVAPAALAHVARWAGRLP